ncbi:MAG: hypothetical protein IK115_01495 [Lachnospiraceae bacterium]|nr:hypothetical protein [Lachnospiraceae bacterium]
MQWYEGIIEKLEFSRTYSHKELLGLLKRIKPNLADTTYHWSISCLIRDGKIFRRGYDAYSLSQGEELREYQPFYSDETKKLINLIANRYPHVSFTVFETVLMNDFLNHLIAQNTIFVQVEKESSIYVFRYLQDEGYDNVLYKPRQEDMTLYWSKGSIIVTDMVSEAPLRAADPHVITLEKILVDMLADKLILASYSKAEYPDVIEQAESRFLLDNKRMLRYAKRRNRYKEICNYLEGRIENAGT